MKRSCNDNEISTATTDDVEYLKYGQDFMLECYESKHKPVLVYSMPKNPFAACHDNVFKAHGEMKQFVGLALHDGANNNGDKSSSGMESIPSAFFLWRLYHVDPEMRYETIGENIPVCPLFMHWLSSGFCLQSVLLHALMSSPFDKIPILTGSWKGVLKYVIKKGIQVGQKL